MSALPERLKLVRSHKGLTQRQLAERLNLSPSTIALYETGNRNPDPDMLKKLADFLDCSIDWLLGRVTLDEVHQLNGSFRLAHDKHDSSNDILAAHRTDDPTTVLPADARRSLEEFQSYVLEKYGKK